MYLFSDLVSILVSENIPEIEDDDDFMVDDDAETDTTDDKTAKTGKEVSQLSFYYVRISTTSYVSLYSVIGKRD